LNGFGVKLLIEGNLTAGKVFIKHPRNISLLLN